MGTFGTGLPPGSHGLVGMQVLDPATDRLLNELSWEDGPDPRAWQPNETVFEAAENAGVSVTMVGPHYFDGSGLTTAALRGGRFRAARSLEDRVDAAVAAVRATPRSLVYLYWGEVDKIGHVHGCQSWQWGDEVESVDAALRQLAARVPDDTSIVVTADHGMVDVPFHDRIDLVHEPGLMAGVRHLGGEPRNLQLYTEPGATADVEAAWASRLGDRARILSRERLVDEGWFGPVRPEVEGRDRRPRRRHGRLLRRRPLGAHATRGRRAARPARVDERGGTRRAGGRGAAPPWRLGWCLVAELVFFSGTMDCGKSTLALQMDHNHGARGRVGLIFTKMDRAGSNVLSSRLGLSTGALEVGDDLDFWEAIVGRATAGTRIDYLICDEAQFYTGDQVEQLARIVDEMDVDVFAFGITADFRTELFPGSKRLIELADRVQVLQVEALCWCGRRATTNARVMDGVMVVEGEQVVVGDTKPGHRGRRRVRGALPPALHASDDLARGPGRRGLARGAALRPRRVPPAAPADHPGRLRPPEAVCRPARSRGQGASRGVPVETSAGQVTRSCGRT